MTANQSQSVKKPTPDLGASSVRLNPAVLAVKSKKAPIPLGISSYKGDNGLTQGSYK